jgi:hypothetical protein
VVTLPCPACELARDLERHARLIALGLEDARAVELAALPPEEREAVRREEEFLSSLLVRISERRYGLV